MYNVEELKGERISKEYEEKLENALQIVETSDLGQLCNGSNKKKRQKRSLGLRRRDSERVGMTKNVQKQQKKKCCLVKDPGRRMHNSKT
jgi:hypothetical protein